MAVIPEKVVILLSGIPATGKSSFGRYLAREYGFAHYDLECYPRGWPKRDLKRVWDINRAEFIAELGKYHDRIALDWGFPVQCLQWVKELRDVNVQLVWFHGDIDIARDEFRKRGGLNVEDFNRQVTAIQSAGYPASLDCIVVQSLPASGVYLNFPEIERLVFPA